MPIAIKAFSGKNAILVVAFKTPVLRTSDELFSGVYHPQDTRDVKVSSVVPCGEHGEIEPPDPSGIRRIHGNSMEIPWEIHGPVTDY